MTEQRSLEYLSVYQQVREVHPPPWPRSKQKEAEIGLEIAYIFLEPPKQMELHFRKIAKYKATEGNDSTDNFLRMGDSQLVRVIWKQIIGKNSLFAITQRGMSWSIWLAFSSLISMKNNSHYTAGSGEEDSHWSCVIAEAMIHLVFQLKVWKLAQ